MIGHCKGQIVAPQGSQEFGWDACFQPEGFALPFSCLEPSVKNVISHRARAFNHLIKHLQTKKKFDVQHQCHNAVKTTKNHLIYSLVFASQLVPKKKPGNYLNMGPRFQRKNRTKKFL